MKSSCTILISTEESKGHAMTASLSSSLCARPFRSCHRRRREILRSMVRLAIEIKATSKKKQAISGRLYVGGTAATYWSQCVQHGPQPPCCALQSGKDTFCFFILAYDDDGWSYVVKKQKCHTLASVSPYSNLLKTQSRLISYHQPIRFSALTKSDFTGPKALHAEREVTPIKCAFTVERRNSFL